MMAEEIILQSLEVLMKAILIIAFPVIVLGGAIYGIYRYRKGKNGEPQAETPAKGEVKAKPKRKPAKRSKRSEGGNKAAA